MKYRASRSPLTWLGGLLALYLAVPLVAFLIRLAQPGDRGFGRPACGRRCGPRSRAPTIATAIVALFGIPMAYWLARSHGPVARVVGLLVLLPLALPPVMSGLVLIYLVGPYTWLGKLFNGDLTGHGGRRGHRADVRRRPVPDHRRADRVRQGVDPALEDLAASLGHRARQPGSGWCRCGSPRPASAPGCC